MVPDKITPSLAARLDQASMAEVVDIVVELQPAVEPVATAQARSRAAKISAAKDEPAVQLGKEFQDLETRFQWDKRIFEERAQALRSVCDTPVLLEQHLFEIARSIQERL